MGSVHKFPRPPKNRQQFKGYRPDPGPGGGEPARARLRDWQKTVLAWLAVIVLATAFWGFGHVF